MDEKKKPKISNAILSVFAIFAIVLIVWITTLSTSGVSTAQSNANLAGSAIQVAYDSSATGSNENLAFCKMIIGTTTLYDGTTIAASLSAGESVYYTGHTITVKEITKDVCVISVDDGSDYIALGQVQELNSLFITVKDIVK